MEMKTMKRASAFCTALLMAAACVPALPAMAEDGLPASFDLRTKGLVGKVGDQINYETSWAFAALNSVESTQIKDVPQIDLSEWHLAYYTYSNNFGYAYKTASLFNASTDDAEQEMGILTSWVGPVSAENAPVYSDTSIEKSMLTMDEVRAQAEYHVTDTIKFEYEVPEDLGDAAFAAQREAIKTAVYDGHPIDMSYVDSDSCFNKETAAYYYDPAIAGATAYHSVSIVGWDDAFPASRFKSAPGMDGAWLCKDSRGTSWGDNGYIWVSYAEDISDIYEIQAESAKVHTRLYQHDDFGNTGQFARNEDGDNDIIAANVFKAEEDGWVTSVMFCNVQPGTDVELSVNSRLSDENNPSSGTPSETKTVHLDRLGYQTIDLDKPVQITQGEHFAIVAKLHNETAGSLIPCEFTTKTTRTESSGTMVDESPFSSEMLERDFATGQSFYSADGTYWYDMYNVEPKVERVESGGGVGVDENGNIIEGGSVTTETVMRAGNICMKALTRESGNVQFSTYAPTLDPNGAIYLTNDDQAPIFYSLNGVDFELFEEPITFPEGQTEMTITAYADLAVVSGLNEKVKYSQTYTARKASLSSVLCRDSEDFADYAIIDEEDPTVLHYSAPAGTETVTISPMSTGTIKIGDTTYPSGAAIEIPLTDGEASVKIAVEEDGAAPAEYTLQIGETPNEDDYLLGDVTLDGVIDAKDASELLVAATEKGVGHEDGLEEIQRKAADVNLDGAYNATDASYILIYSTLAGVGKTKTFAELIADK